MKSSDTEKKIIGCIKEHGLHGASSTEISKALGINRHTLAKYLNILTAEGKITFKRAGMGKIWFIEKSPLHGVSNGPRDIADTGLKTTLGHILSTMPDGIVVENENYEIEFMNDSLIKKFGNLVGEKCYRAIKGRDEPCEHCPVKEILHKGKLTPLRYQSQDMHGNFYDSIASPIRNPDGSISVIEMVRDITEMKKADEALRESEEMYKQLVETSPDAVTVADLEGKITHVSQRTLKLHGFESPEELIGRNAVELIAPEDHERAAANMQKTLEEGFMENLEYTLLRKDGTTFTGELNAALIKDACGKPKAFIAITRDITERKEAESQIKYLNELKRSVIDNAPFGVLTGDKDGNIIHANPALIKIMGSPSAEKTKSFNLLTLPAIKKAGLDKVFKKVLSEGREFDLEREYVSHWGKRIFTRLKAFPLRDINGEVSGLVAIVEDITDKKNLEAKIAPIPEPLAIPEAQSISP